MAVDGLIVAEPGAWYARRPPLVADCSVIAALVFSESERDAALRILSGHDVHAPNLIDHEIANVAVKKAGKGFDALAKRGLEIYADFRLTRHEVDCSGQWQLAMRYELTAYDSAYLWLAGALRVPLTTFDKKLGSAARRFLKGHGS